MFFSTKELLDYTRRNNLARSVRWQLFARANPDSYRWTQEQLRAYNNINNAPLTFKEAATFLRETKKLIATRSSSAPGKWWRPWNVVPALAQWQPPEGDFGVGVEVEYGFRNLAAAQTVANHIKDWKHITLDTEGGTYPIETTFPPVAYSKFGSKTQACRYLKYLASQSSLIYNHNPDSHIGTHVNVSVRRGERMHCTVSHISDMLYHLSVEQKNKYFGRLPYGYGNNRGRYIEWKLFNSQTDWKVLRRYVDIAVELTKMCYEAQPPSREQLVARLEQAYNKHEPKGRVTAADVAAVANVSNTRVESLAA